MIDEDALAIKVRSLEVLAQSLNNRQKQVQAVLGVLSGIKQRDDGSAPFDGELEQAMSDARRQEIYDRCMARADVLLTIWPSDPDAPPAPEAPPEAPPPEDDT